MITKSKVGKFFGSLLLAGGMLAASGSLFEASAQRDPFAKPVVKASRPVSKNGVIIGDPTKVGPLGVPPVEARVAYYMNVIRPQCIAQGCTQMPKPTVVMTLDEMQVTGISRTPRGYAAIVFLQPINLSYTVYPGEKFYDGQLVAVEENNLVFRKVTKMSNGKYTMAEQKKTLRKMSFQEELVRSSVDTLPSSGATEAEKAQVKPARAAAGKKGEAVDPAKAQDPNKIEFPLEEMVKSEKAQPEKSQNAKPKPAAKGKTVAKKKN